MSSIRVCSFESRRADDIRSLIERNGGVCTNAPSLRELPLDENPAVFTFADRLFAGDVDVLVFMTGVGARALWDVLRQRYEADKILEALARCTTVVRGPKPTAVLREWHLRIDVRVPEPNTWRELLQTLDTESPVAGRRVAVQEYGLPNEELYAALSARGADVLPVPVYRWDLPEETGPLRAAVQGTIDGRFDVLLFTSAQQIVHVLKIAAELGQEDAFRTAANRCLLASIGPTCSERLQEFGLTVDMEPSHPKMGHLVREAIEAARNRVTPE